MNRSAVYFVAPGRVEVREESVLEPGPGEVLVETELSGISAGTEMLIYRGQFPRGLAEADDTLSGDLHYPLCYGYSCVGRVKAIGDGVELRWRDKRVFSFQPHCSEFRLRPENLMWVPDSVPSKDAVFLPNMETAVNLTQDAAPLLGERALVLGQGVVGLLTASLLHEFPLERLVTADRYKIRRRASSEIGISECIDPTFSDFRTTALKSIGRDAAGYDLTIELSGNPSALDDAIALTTFSGRIVVGSWYGEKRAGIDLGGKFHRSRIEIISSQVSTISPKLAGRWDKDRRFSAAWHALEHIRPQKWITHEFPVNRAEEAYKLLDESPEEAIQVILTYS